MFTVQNYKTYKNQKKIVRVLFAAAPFFAILIDWLLEGRIRSIFTSAVGFYIMVVISVLLWIFSPKPYDNITQRNVERILFKEGRLNILGKRELIFEEEYIHYITEHGELTVSFCDWHSHYNDDEDYKYFIDDINGILHNKKCSLIVKSSKRWLSSELINDDEKNLYIKKLKSLPYEFIQKIKSIHGFACFYYWDNTHNYKIKL